MSADRQQGFTLLEVVVALTIATLAVVVLFRAGSDGLFSVDTASHAEEALQRAQSHLAALGNTASLAQGTSEGDDGGGYHWHVRIEPIARRQTQSAETVATPALTTTLFDVEITESWPARGHDRSVVLRTRRLGSADATLER